MSKPARATRTDGEQTRQRILDVAGPLFAEHGFAETPSKAIAEQAGVDLASINYHFGSRNGLYLAALTQAHGMAFGLDSLQTLADSDLPASAKITRMLDVLIDTAMNDQDWYARLLAREVLTPGPHLAVMLEAVGTPKIAVAQRIVSEATGIPVGDPALLRCLFSMVAPGLILLAAGQGLPGPAQDVRCMPKEDVRAHMHRFALAGLEAVSQTYQQG